MVRTFIEVYGAGLRLEKREDGAKKERMAIYVERGSVGTWGRLRQ
jgi:hypothetical protein